jgi:hypothetical protein
MFGLLLAFCIVSAPSPEPWEALDFGITPEAAVAHALLAGMHADMLRGEVVGWNRPEDVERWELEVELRFRCWDDLADALCGRSWVKCSDGWRLIDFGASDYRTRNNLARLRDRLGAADFAARRMPDPLPHYRRGPQD